MSKPLFLQLGMPHEINARGVTFRPDESDPRIALAQFEVHLAMLVNRAIAEEREACAAVSEAAGRDHEELAGRRTEWGLFIARKIRDREGLA